MRQTNLSLPFAFAIGAQFCRARSRRGMLLSRAHSLCPTCRSRCYRRFRRELLKRRGLRILVVPNRTHFFVDRGVTQGITYDAFRKIFEKFLNFKALEQGNSP